MHDEMIMIYMDGMVKFNSVPVGPGTSYCHYCVCASTKDMHT